jgi:hypothetical protein
VSHGYLRAPGGAITTFDAPGAGTGPFQGAVMGNYLDARNVWHRFLRFPEGPSLYYSAPIRVDSQSCLFCHASAEDAPREMTKMYGKNNGFGWKLNDIIGAQIVSVPARLVNESADAAVTRVLCWLAAGYALVFVVVNLGVYFLARR